MLKIGDKVRFVDNGDPRSATTPIMTVIGVKGDDQYVCFWFAEGRQGQSFTFPRSLLAVVKA